MGYIYTKSGKLAKRLYFGAVLLFEGLYYTFKNRVLADGGTFVENELPTISQDAKLVLTPNAYKAGNLYSAVPNDGTGDFIVERNSTATYIDEDGLIKTALVNVPRFDWSTGVPVILRELQRTNLIPKSETIDYSFWSYNAYSTATLNAETSPDGLLTGDKVIPNVDSTSTYTGINTTGASSGTFATGNIITLSAFLKIGGYKIVEIGGVFGNESSMVNLESKTIISQKSNVIGTNITSISGGWVRVSITYYFQNSIGNNWLYTGVRIKKDDESNSGYDGVSGIYIWGAQLEQASTASSYIPTNGSTVTRLADNISVPTPAGVTSITETIDGVEQAPITTIPATYSLPVGNINKVTML